MRATCCRQHVGWVSLRFRFPRRANHLYKFAPSRPTQRGVSRSSRTRDGVRWTRQRFARDGIAGRVSACERSTARGRGMLLRTAKSCGPDAPMLASSLAEVLSALPGSDKTLIRETTVAKEPGHRGEPDISC